MITLQHIIENNNISTNFIIVAALCCFAFIVQLFFYLKPFCGIKLHKKRPQNGSSQPVSLIIACRNEYENLKINLSSFLCQIYDNYEVIIVDDNSTDQSFEYLSNIKDEKLRVIKNSGIGKKSALTTGINASKNKYLIFSDADCKAISKNWISEMISQISEETQIVIGIGTYKANNFISNFSSYDTLIIALQYIGFAEFYNPYMCVGRNLAYTKNIWSSVNGFASHIKTPSGDDDLFIIEASKTTKVATCISNDSLTISNAKSCFCDLLKQKKRHVSTSKQYPFYAKILSGGEIISRIIFFILVILLALLNIYAATLLILIRLIFVTIIVSKFTQRLSCKLPIAHIIIFDIFAVFFYTTLSLYKPSKSKLQW